ncbi:MFS transporter [Amycolatopsis acidiphila]|uniref:MFS transporter n=1 Tax=Amycolatopsis acidiphila TaxID=715473 RepID=UPI0019C7E6DC|nr:MFS transporter [Amycolatopsis acidiphila]UIJ61940.1 MFS transporter [Amycolatopsis acidiphila]GHG57021.1 hypothetical protein GCM10017788_08310 [Amycolatopsis acidiphila]
MTSSARALALAQLANSVGDGACFVCSALYFTLVLGFSAAQVGLGLTVGWALGAVAGVLAGHVADRRGARGTAVFLAAATAVSLLLFLLEDSFAFFVLSACLYSACRSGLSAARQALLAGLVGSSERTRTRARLQSAQNVGLAVGAALGGIALSVDTREAFLAAFALDAATFALAGLALRRLPSVAPCGRCAGSRRWPCCATGRMPCWRW